MAWYSKGQFYQWWSNTFFMAKDPVVDYRNVLIKALDTRHMINEWECREMNLPEVVDMSRMMANVPVIKTSSMALYEEVIRNDSTEEEGAIMKDNDIQKLEEYKVKKVEELLSKFLATNGSSIYTFSNNLKSYPIRHAHLCNLLEATRPDQLILGSFLWSDTSEGRKYWVDMAYIWRTSSEMRKCELLWNNEEEIVHFQEGGKAYGHSNIIFAEDLSGNRSIERGGTSDIGAKKST